MLIQIVDPGLRIVKLFEISRSVHGIAAFNKFASVLLNLPGIFCCWLYQFHNEITSKNPNICITQFRDDEQNRKQNKAHSKKTDDSAVTVLRSDIRISICHIPRHLP